MRENLLHFPISYYVSIKFALCLPVPCVWFANHYIVQLLSAAIAHNLMYATKTTTDTTIVINPSQLRKNWQSSPSAAIVF
jgi:hypothetical protein